MDFRGADILHHVKDNYDTRNCYKLNQLYSNPSNAHMNVGKIKSYPRNAKKHPQEQIKKIADSIQEFGFNK